MRQPLFLSLDGQDGTGKSTQAKLLADWLRGDGYLVTTCADPGGTAVGQVLRGLLLEHKYPINLTCEALLFMASRAQLVSEVIRPALAQGQVVISDRYVLANVVYQGHAGGLDPDLLWQVGRMATGGLEPDLTIVLDLKPETARARRPGPPDRMEDRSTDFQMRVREGFLAEARRRPDCIRVVDASADAEEVHLAIRKLVVEKMTP